MWFINKIKQWNNPGTHCIPQGFTLQKDKRVKLTYTILKDRMSIYMNGSIAEITSISYL